MNIPTPASASLQTVAEKSGFTQTGRTDEVSALCVQFAKTWPEAVRCIQYGTSVEGRPMLALIASRAGTLDATELRSRKVPILMIQGGIHPGESDGKDAGFIALRELLDGSAAKGTLDRIAVLFVPAFNVDGHERFGRWNRPNQVGPEETGWRATAQNLNLNRDYTKAEAPEMQAMLRLITQWDPLVCADLHVTDGADFEPDISNQAEPVNQGDPQLRASGVQIRDELNARLAGQGSIPLPFYPDFARTDDPSSGFILTVYSPRFSTGYFPQRNRFTVLVETHSWKPYATRVRVTRNTIVGLAEIVAARGAELLELTRKSDEAALALGGKELTLDYASGWREPTKAGGGAGELSDDDARMIEFRGYAYTRTMSPISGGLVTVYDPKTPRVWHVPLRDKVKPSLVVTAPRGGYVVSSGFAAQIAAKLDAHGISYERLAKTRLGPTSAASASDAIDVEAFRATDVKFSSAPFEGCMRATLSGSWKEERRSVGPGALFVPIAQPLARLVVALFEPQAPDSFAAWGFFNACFEDKEHTEPYVAEQIAHEMLAGDADLRVEFERKLKTDAPFAANPNARLEFFLRRHSSWDERLNLYPVFRVASAPA
jgi:zinc carboxypeptidase